LFPNDWCVLRRQITHVATIALLVAAPLAIAGPGDFPTMPGGLNFLPPHLAFKPSATAQSSEQIEARFDIQPGYYLYRNKIAIESTGLLPADVRVTTGELPPGIQKDDPNFGPTEIYTEPLSVPVKISGGQRPLTLTLSVRYQGCASQGICYPPEVALLPVTLPTVDATPVAEEPTPVVGEAQNGVHEIARSLDQGDLWLNLLLFFGAGIGLAFTPCMLPMMPIVATVVLGRHDAAHPLSHLRGFMLALAYVLGMALTYALAGVFAGLSGTLISGVLQNPWVLGSFALVYVVLAGGMLGFYNLQLPNALQGKLAEESNRVHGGSLPAAVILGALSALIVGPCVAAPLAGALLYIGQTGNALLGGCLLFIMAFGMGIPLLAMGASAGTLVIKTGPWMETIKKAFGFILLGTAWWILAPVLPDGIVMAGFGVLAITAGVLLKALERLPERTQLSRRLGKALGVVFVALGLAWLAGAFGGATRLDRPLSPFIASAHIKTTDAEPLPMARVTTIAALDAALRDTRKPAFIDVYADWCVSCKEFERDTLGDPAVRQALDVFTLIRVDVTASDAEAQSLLKRFGLYGPPGMVFYAPGGRLLLDATLAGYVGPEDFLKQLKRVQTLAEKTAR
jgi:thiol:disulfide interchange protein DsbD